MMSFKVAVRALRKLEDTLVISFRGSITQKPLTRLRVTKAIKVSIWYGIAQKLLTCLDGKCLNFLELCFVFLCPSTVLRPNQLKVLNSCAFWQGPP